MLWVILVRMGWPIDLAKIIDRYAAIVHVLGCVVPACPRIAVNAEHLCRFHSEKSSERYFYFPDLYPIMRVGVYHAVHMLLCYRHYLFMRIRDMENRLAKNFDKKVNEASEVSEASEELSDLRIDCDRVEEAVAMLTWWGKHQ